MTRMPTFPAKACAAALDPQRVAAIGQIDWLAECEPGTLRLLARHSRLLRRKPGETVIRRGEPVDCLHLLTSGSLEVGITTAAGRHFVTNYLEPGQVFGLVPLLDGKGAIHDARAHEPCTLLLIPAQDFHAALQADPALQRRVLSLLAGRSRRLYTTLTDTSVQPLALRLARLLLSLRAAYGVEARAEGDAIGLRVSQEGLAATLGVPRQRLNGELKSMEREGVVRMAYSRIVIVDEAALRDLAAESRD